jgi:RNA polymerase sigma-70 factor (ECF subfamily)
MNHNNEDWSIVESCLNGNREAYALLVKKYEKSVFNIVCRLIGITEEARDITQETFIKAYKSLRQVKPEFKFSNWLFKIATNLCKDRLKKRKITAVSLNEFDYLLDQGISHENKDSLLDYQKNLIPTDEQEQVQRAISNLPFIYRRVVVLRYIQDLTYQEIADILEMPLGRVKVQLHRAHQILYDQLSDMLK